MEVLREQETGHSSEAGICRLSLPALLVSYINRPGEKPTFQDNQVKSDILSTT